MTVRPIILGTRVLCVFVAVVLLLLTMIPRPISDVDYLIVGAVGTFAGLVVIFGALARDFTTLRQRQSVLPLDTPAVDSRHE